MELTKSVTGRKVFYADPYKVPDGSPTIGTVRDANLFKNELSAETVTFGADQRGLFIRLVEVDSNTDEIISFDASVATRSYTSIPFATGFEDGKVNEKYWALSTENSSGRVEVTHKHEPNSGDYHLAFDVHETGTSSVNRADLHINLKGILSDVILDISYKSYGEQINSENGIYFSDDEGATFKKVHEFEVIPNTYIDTTLNINDLVCQCRFEFFRQIYCTIATQRQRFHR
jgi:hypothetical protein